LYRYWPAALNSDFTGPDPPMYQLAIAISAAYAGNTTPAVRHGAIDFTMPFVQEQVS
jgi:hypothetical protein